MLRSWLGDDGHMWMEGVVFTDDPLGEFAARGVESGTLRGLSLTHRTRDFRRLSGLPGLVEQRELVEVSLVGTGRERRPGCRVASFAREAIEDRRDISLGAAGPRDGREREREMAATDSSQSVQMRLQAELKASSDQLMALQKQVAEIRELGGQEIAELKKSVEDGEKARADLEARASALATQIQTYQAKETDAFKKSAARLAEFLPKDDRTAQVFKELETLGESPEAASKVGSLVDVLVEAMQKPAFATEEEAESIRSAFMSVGAGKRSASRIEDEISRARENKRAKSQAVETVGGRRERLLREVAATFAKSMVQTYEDQSARAANGNARPRQK